MEGASRAVVILANGRRVTAIQALAADAEHDVALLNLDLDGGNFPALPMTESIPVLGTKVVAIGSPLGLSQTVSEGIVSAHRDLDGHQLVQISAPISPGSSGGPVLNEYGRVFAIATAQLRGGQQLNFAVPVRYAIQLLATRPSARPIADLFGSAHSRVAKRREALAPDPEGPGHAESPSRPVKMAEVDLGLPFRTPSPREHIRGVYWASRRFYLVKEAAPVPASELPRWDPAGTLILGQYGLGLLSLTTMHWPEAPQTTTLALDSILTTPGGRVVLAFRGDPMGVWQGHQTVNGGFSVMTMHALPDSMRTRYAAYLHASRTPVSSEVPIGRHRVTFVEERETSAAKRGWFSKRPAPPPAPVEGEAVVIVNDSAVAIQLHIEQQGGPPLRGFFTGSLEDFHRFALIDGPRSLTGTILRGDLRAEYTEQRTLPNGRTVTIHGTVIGSKLFSQSQ